MAPSAQNSSLKDARLFIVEGNIGAGKSTFLRLLQTYFSQMQIIFEPLSQWQAVGGTENLLEKFYIDAPRWAYTMQSYAFVSRIREYEQAAKKSQASVLVLERSVFSDRYCFAKNLFETGAMSALEWKLYQEWFAWLVEQYVYMPAGFIYLQTNPDVCYRRLQHRGRFEEAVVPQEYLTQLHVKHEQWLVAKEEIAPQLKDIPVLVLSCNADFENTLEEQKRHMKLVEQFIELHTAGYARGQLGNNLSLSL